MTSFIRYAPIFVPVRRHVLALPFFVEGAACGFPSPAADHVEADLDLNDLCVRHPAATFFVRADGDSMNGASGIFDGDMLIVDRSLVARDGNVVVAVIDGEFTVKRLRKRKGSMSLVADNPTFGRIELLPEQECLVWGVVTHVLHAV